MEDIFYLKEHKVLFGKDEYGEYVPTHYNVAVDDRGTPIEGTEIVDGDILFDWLVYVKETMKTRSAKTGKWRNGNLYMYQWGVSINIVLDIMSFKADIWDIAWSRQSGKSRMMQELPAFITVFGQKYADLKNENGWTTIVASYTDKAVKKWYAPIRDKIYKAIELFNRMYPNSPLVYGKNKYKNVADTEEHMVIDIVFENKSYTYSEIWALSTGTDQDGFSAATLFLDEATLTKAFGEDGFFKSLKPFTNSV